MQAVVHDTYGSADVLEVREVDRPAVGEADVLVRVRAASVNASDWYTMAGLPYFVRLGSGLFRPRQRIRGFDLAGNVEAVGPQVTRFVPGDSVFGMAKGSFAEYVSGREDKLTPIPAGITFEQAAAVPVAGLTALQALRDHGQLRSGQRVLITGASGGVGSFAVQIAKSMGADVTGICGPSNVDLVRSLGADDVIDYSRADFVDTKRRFDLLFDIRATRPLRRCLRLLKPGGTYVLAGGPRGRWLGPLIPIFKVVVSKPFFRHRLRVVGADINSTDLTLLSELIVSGKVSPAIDRVYSLKEVPDAIRYWENEHVRGKLVIVQA